ncbi:hypothetical protein GALL_413280 [mine drainage metagenome]|uniref:Uncharacterized protein n=1 Tax=mine drainage metagenome TaxID=410659 RepID=A0A1J5QLS8_9ZZZZ
MHHDVTDLHRPFALASQQDVAVHSAVMCHEFVALEGEHGMAAPLAVFPRPQVEIERLPIDRLEQRADLRPVALGCQRQPPARPRITGFQFDIPVTSGPDSEAKAQGNRHPELAPPRQARRL